MKIKIKLRIWRSCMSDWSVVSNGLREGVYHGVEHIPAVIRSYGLT